MYPNSEVQKPGGNRMLSRGSTRVVERASYPDVIYDCPAFAEAHESLPGDFFNIAQVDRGKLRVEGVEG